MTSVLLQLLRQKLRTLPFARRWYQRAKRLRSAKGSFSPPFWNLPNLRSITTLQAQKRLQAFLESGARFAFPHGEAPQVSVIIAVWNRAELTLQTLESLRGSEGLEVIVVDNASSDDTARLLSRIDGLVVITNPTNLHFLRATNEGAKRARGRYLCLLNSDTRVLPGTIERAFQRLDGDRTLGAIGGILRLPDGSLQEAGSFIWRDGTCEGYGRGDDPLGASYQHEREVDFCSGAFLMTPKDLWEELHGLSDDFAPAYYEEVDYCLRVWESGRRVLFDPTLVVEHFEFASAAHLHAPSELMEAHRELLVRRHHRLLASREEKSSDRLPRLRLRRRNRPTQRILWIDERVPLARYGHGYPRAAAIQRMLCELGGELTVYPCFFEEGNERWDEIYELLPRTVEVMARTPWGPPGFERFLKERQGFYDSVVISRPPAMDEVRRVLRKHPTLLALDQVIYDAEAIFTNREREEAKVQGRTVSEQALQQQLATELARAHGVRGVMAVSEREAEQFRIFGLTNVVVVSHPVSSQRQVTLGTERDTILFVGSIHGNGGPNYDAMWWFCQEVLPRVVQRGIAASLVIAGHNLSSDLQALRGPRVVIPGFEPSLQHRYDRARVFIAPTRFSAGIPLKVIEAAAQGVPCIVTPLLAAQLGWPQEALSVADHPDEWLAAIADLFSDDEKWLKQAHAASQVVASQHGESIVRDALKKLFER